jgi:DNA-directed RNA polymerase III subunit RPC2
MPRKASSRKKVTKSSKQIQSSSKAKPRTPNPPANEISGNKIRTKDLLSHFIPTTKRLVSAHLRSFNYFLNNGIKNIVNAKVNRSIQSDVLNDFKITFKNIFITKPEITENYITRAIYPQECRLREMSYSGNIMIDIDIQGVYDSKDNSSVGKLSLSNLCIGKMPIMLGSDYCWLNDKGSVGFSFPKSKTSKISFTT